MLKVKLRSSKRKATGDDGPPQHSSTEEEIPCTTSNHARYMKTYRKKMKEERPAAYKIQCDIENERSRNFRSNLCEEKRLNYNEKAKERMQRMRCKKLEAMAVANCSTDPETKALQTRSMEEKLKAKREKEKLRKRAERAKMNPQKKRRVRERDAWYHMEKRAILKRETVADIPTGNGIDHLFNEEQPFATNNACRKAISRAKKSIPASSSKGAEVLKGLVLTATPRKKALLEKAGISVNKTGHHDGDLMRAIKRTCSKMGKRKREFIHGLSGELDSVYGLKSKACRSLGFQWNYLMKYSKMRKKGLDASTRKKRSDALPNYVRKSLQEHYIRPDVSTEMPNKKGLAANAVSAKHVLQRTIASTYKSFREEHPTFKVGRSKFAALRPKNVVTQRHANLYQCLCEYCANIDLKIEAIKKELARHKKVHLLPALGDKYDTCAKTICEHEGKYPRYLCVERKCPECGVGELETSLADALGSDQITWLKWDQIEYPDGKKRIGRKRCQGTGEELAAELAAELAPFAKHLFEARWQQAQFYRAITHPPPAVVMMVMDFAENYTCITQREVQGAHWYQTQITLHPMIAYFKCQDPGCDKQDSVREVINIVSDDMQHDASAVHHFTTVAVTHLRQIRGITVERLVQFSDGCSAQYKSKTPFTDLSFASQDLGIPTVERHFFGARHGKNPCDGEGGVVKNSASRAVHSENDLRINSAEDFFLFAISRLTRGPRLEDGSCNHSRRAFYLVKKGEIARNRPARTEVSTLPGTRSLHAAVGIGRYHLKVRRLSCFCNACNSPDDTTTCPNNDYVSGWMEKKLRLKPGVTPEDVHHDLSEEGLPTAMSSGKLR